MSDKPITERYRPRTLDALYGQSYIRAELAAFLASPYPAAMIFAGDTGTGKSSAALALANDLDCHPSEFIEIRSGQADGETLESLSLILSYSPMSSGWRVVVFTEADMMTPKAERLFLSLLETIPARTLVVFTTNRPEWFDGRPRLRDRCEVYRFASDAESLRHDAARLIADLWAAEGGQGSAPSLDDLPGVIDGDGRLSFRRVAQAVGRELRRDEAFRLAAPAMPQPSIFAHCGPFGRKPGKTTSPANDRTTAVLEPITAAPILEPEPDTYDLAPWPGDEVLSCDRDIEPEPEPGPVGYVEPGPIAARRWAWDQPDGSPRPSINSVSRRWNISWDTARRVITERWGFAEASA